MKCFRRYLSVFVCCVLLFLVSSLNVSAEEVDFGEYTIDFKTALISNGTYWKEYSMHFDPFDDIENQQTASPVWIGKISDLYAVNRWTFKPKNSGSIIKAGGEVTTILVKGQANILLQYMDSSQNVIKNNYDRNLKEIFIQVYYIDGTYETFLNQEVSIVNTNNHNFKCTFTPTKDVAYFIISSKNTFAEPDFSYAQTEVNVYHGDYFNTEGGWKLSISQDSKEVGLLGSIIEWIKGIFNKIGDMFDKVTEGFSNIGKWLGELPAKIWEFISEGLKSLFVPTDEFIVGFKDDIDNLLEQKMGAIYQVFDIITNGWDKINANDIDNTINLPKTTIDLPKNNSFSFGGYDIVIVPNGFEWLATAIKGFVGILVTLLILNGLRKRYDDVME